MLRGSCESSNVAPIETRRWSGHFPQLLIKCFTKMHRMRFASHSTLVSMCMRSSFPSQCLSMLKTSFGSAGSLNSTHRIKSKSTEGLGLLEPHDLWVPAEPLSMAPSGVRSMHSMLRIEAPQRTRSLESALVRKSIGSFSCTRRRCFHGYMRSIHGEAFHASWSLRR